jgi:uncharacterized protein
MTEKGPESDVKKEDRRLGDEWLDWNGSSNQSDSDIDEKLGTFVILAALSIVVLLAGIQFGWYLSKPRIEQWSHPLSYLLEWSVLVVSTLFIVIASIEAVLLLGFHRSLVPYVWAERIFLSLLSRSVWLGAKFGISRDRVANSFIKVHNIMVESHTKELKTDGLLVLVPRCLEKDSRRQVMERASGRAIRVVTAAGGEEARKAIKQYKPSIILAIACERDLISGIKDVADKVPVLAIPNRRPEGPCKNTRVYLKDLDDVLEFIAQRMPKTQGPLQNLLVR